MTANPIAVHGQVSATGTILGVLVDAENGETLIGANVVIEGTTIGSTTDLDGHYSITSAPAGLHTVVFSYIGYTPQTIRNVEVIPGQRTRIDLALSTEAIGMGEVVVEARAIRNNESVLLRDRQKALAVSDAISAEAISRSGSGDAAAAMTKVTGASVVGGRYVYIRGLGDRYSSTHLNGSELPSADPDKKAFQLDMFPASLLDNIVTTKTFTPDKPGNFSGGLVNVGTKSFPDKLNAQISISTTYNTQTTGDDYLAYTGSDTDWLGFDDGLREIPDILKDPEVEIPSEVEARFDPEKAALLDQASRAFNSVMTPGIDTAPMNRSVSLAIGNQVKAFKRPLGFTASFTYNRESSSYDNGEVGRWELVGGNIDDVGRLTALRLFSDSTGFDRKGSRETTWGGMASLAYKPHPRHEISTTFLRTQSGISESRSLAGFWQDLTGNSTFETRVLGYKERRLVSLQGKGKHVLRPFTLEWRGSLSDNAQEEPDLRYFSNHFTVRDRDGVIDTLYQSPASLYPAPTRFFRNLTEQNGSMAADITVPFTQWSGLKSNFKVGFSYVDITREFRERRFEYNEGRGFSFGDFEGDIDAYFSATGIIDTTSTGRPVFGNVINDASSDRSNYDGDKTISAYYAMIEIPLLQRLRLVGGARLERTDMSTVSQDTTLTPGELDNNDWLPSANLIYQLADNMNLRAAFTKTLARPTFRELAPYATFDFVGDFVFRGNSTLKRTLIANYDFRWEWFTRPGEIIAVSGFYKQFENPIERVIQTSTGNNSLSVQNVEEGRVYGLELEIRKSLDQIAAPLRDFRFGGNLSIVQSEVDIPEEELTVIRAADPDAATTRSLEGQSPFLANLDLTYDNMKSGSVVSVYYNIFGKRLITVSEGAAPDIFERSRSTIDVIYSQRLPRGVSLKVSAKNLLNSEIKTSQVLNNTEFIYGLYRNGRSFSVGFSYSL